ncbi:ABC transporter permease [Pyrococcus yayanosii]|uniref:ABC-type iron(III) transport system, permease component n=1 Tax=Pyrococcus yayanosii (strain CH1 / JCM 16557) TaxID=529709 RepID=F8AES7_PYRYC|nr:iron ABC transporter permease [Pyrococcus yayanosii]AEH24759.1 ABC-type iron(III) transport system, permease component [Pyrococcus yayanosii CH1]
MRSKILLLASLSALALLFYYPVVSILVWGFSPSTLLEVLRDEYYRRVIAFTFWQAILSTLLTLAIGLPGAYLFANYEFPGKRVLKALLTVPFVMPSVMVALGFIVLFGRSGMVASLIGRDPGILYSWKAIILAHAFYNFPVVLRMVSALWERISPSYEEVASTLGAKGFTLFFSVTLPMLLPGLAAAGMLTFIFCFMSFSIPLILGGYRYTTLEVAIFTSIMTLLDFRTGSALALLQMAFSFTFMYLYLNLLDEYSRASSQGIIRRQRRVSLGDLLTVKGLVMLLYFAFITAFILGPLFAVVYSSLIYGDRLSLEWYKRLFSEEYNPLFGTNVLGIIKNSLLFGFSTVVLATLLALLTAYVSHRWSFRGKRVFDTLATLPLASSPIVLGLGYLLAFREFVGSPLLIIMAHTTMAYPFALRSISAALKKVGVSVREAAMSLGATELRAFLNVELPLALGGLIVGAIFSFAMSMAELGATYMLYKPEYTTMTIAVYRYIGARQFGPASALAVLLMVISAIGFMIIERVGEEAW